MKTYLQILSGRYGFMKSRPPILADIEIMIPTSIERPLEALTELEGRYVGGFVIVTLARGREPVTKSIISPADETKTVDWQRDQKGWYLRFVAGIAFEKGYARSGPFRELVQLLVCLALLRSFPFVTESEVTGTLVANPKIITILEDGYVEIRSRRDMHQILAPK